jgi:hypothetical protein
VADRVAPAGAATDHPTAADGGQPAAPQQAPQQAPAPAEEDGLLDTVGRKLGGLLG